MTFWYILWPFCMCFPTLAYTFLFLRVLLDNPVEYVFEKTAIPGIGV
jgi:hypothetical protein